MIQSSTSLSTPSYVIYDAFQGPAPLLHTLLNGDSRYGITILEALPRSFDKGKILNQVPLDVPLAMSGPQFWEHTAKLMARTLVEYLDAGPSFQVNLCMSLCMFVCVYVPMYVCLCVCSYVCLSVCMFLCMFVCVYVPMYVFLCVCSYVCLSVCMFLCMFVCVYVPMYVCLCVCLSVFFCVFLCSAVCKCLCAV